MVQVLDIALLVIIAMIILVILVFTPESPVEIGREAAENVTVGVVRLAGSPSIEAIGPEACPGGVCMYPIRLSDLRVKLDRPADAAITLHFRGQDVVAAIGALDEDNLLQLSHTFEAPYPDLPPVLNASDRTTFSGLLYDGQRLILGNFSVDISILKFPKATELAELIEKAQLSAKCGGTTQRAALSEGDIADIPLCDGSIFIKLDKLATSEVSRASYACAEVAVLGGPAAAVPVSQQPADSITVRFWKFDEVFRFECGVAGQPIGEGQVFPRGQLLQSLLTRASCTQRLMGGFTLRIPVTSWQPGFNSLSEEGCSISY